MQVRKERVVHPGEAFRYLRIETDGFHGQQHRHHQLELTWIERGSGLRFVGDSVNPFAADDLVLIGVNVPHSWLSSSRGRAHSAVATVVQFSVKLLELEALPELRRARPVAERARLGLLITGACRTAVVEILCSMRSADAYARLAGVVRILGLLIRHAHDLAPIAASPMHGPEHSVGQDRLDRVTDWIARRVSGPLRVANAAAIVGVTPAAFSRFFRREAGKAFSAYVNDVRCGEACVKLRQSRKPVAQVARECGFRSLAHFNRQFRRRTGVTPRAYRRAR
jgi:AraC-like DNA-binding protein